MIHLIKDILRPLYRFITHESWRVYYRLSSKYSHDKRFQIRDVTFFNSKITIVDSLSFVHQFKEIFLDEVYKFDARKDNPVIYDCGANIGLSCLYFKRMFPRSTIKAFEADPEIFDVLKTNLSRNIFDDSIQLFNTAIWTTANGIEFGQEGADGGSVILTAAARKTFVRSTRLRDLLMEEKVDFLKMDIEGAEVDVLLDCADVLHQVQALFFEYHSFRGQPQKLDQLLKIMNDNDFRYFIQSADHVRAPFTQPHVDSPMDLQLNVFCYRL